MNTEHCVIITNINNIIINLRESNTEFDNALYNDLNTLIEELNTNNIDDCDCDLINEYYNEVFNACIDDNTNKSLNTALHYMQLVMSEFDDEIRFIDINEYL
jgi:hypothetical protein